MISQSAERVPAEQLPSYRAGDASITLTITPASAPAEHVLFSLVADDGRGIGARFSPAEAIRWGMELLEAGLAAAGGAESARADVSGEAGTASPIQPGAMIRRRIAEMPRFDASGPAEPLVILTKGEPHSDKAMVALLSANGGEGVFLDLTSEAAMNIGERFMGAARRADPQTRQH